MNEQHSVHTYFDMSLHAEEETAFFFLEHLLRARIALRLDTGTHENDEEINVYLAGMLLAFISTDRAIREKPYLSPYDQDIRSYLEEHEDPRTEYTVCKDNADFGLVSTAVFLGHEHPGSFFHRTMAGKTDESGRIAHYYHRAANALTHLRGNRVVLVKTFHSMADTIGDVVRIVRTASADYFEFIEHLSEGSLFHLETEIDRKAKDDAYKTRIDAFLKAYSEYSTEPTEGRKAGLMALVDELRRMNPEFRFTVE